MKIGTFTIPDVDPARAVEFAKAVYEFPNHKISKTGFAEKKKLNIKGGWFGQVIRSLRDYGLIKEIDDIIETTALTEKLLYPKPESTELQEAKEEVFNSVSLWEKLLGNGIKKTDTAKEDFWVYLSEIEGIKGIDRKEVSNKAPLIQKSYITALSYIQNTLEPESQLKADFTIHKIERKVTGFGGGERKVQNVDGKKILKIQYGDLYVEAIEQDDAKTAIKLIAQKLGLTCDQQK